MPDRTIPGQSIAGGRVCRGAEAIGIAAFVLVLLALISARARAEVQVQRDGETVRIELREASIAQALDALGATIKLRYRSTVALDKVVSATYAGPLNEVLRRLLRDYNYWIRSGSDGVELAVIGLQHGERASAPAPVTAAPAKAAAARPPPPPPTARRNSLTSQWRSAGPELRAPSAPRR
jgi:hypothetical protein